MINIIRRNVKNYKQLHNTIITSVRQISNGQEKKNITHFKKLIFFALPIISGLLFTHRLLSSEPVSLPWYIPRVKAVDSLRDQFNFIGSVVQKCAPAVVYIEIQDSRRIDPETNESLIISNGSGFIVRDDGWILTNAHVVINKPRAIIAVKLPDGSVYHATVEDADMNIDLALLKINPKSKLPALHFAESDDVKVGEWVVALGSPLSLSHSVTAGIISSVNRRANELGLRNHSMQYIQTDASITFGNSGGPLVNLDGDVIGINNLRITAGISFAIPIATNLKIGLTFRPISWSSSEAYAKKFLRNGRHPLGDNNKTNRLDDSQQLGIATVQLTDIVMEELQLKENISGVFVWKVILDSPAFRSGLQAGDIITHVNGMTINQIADIYKKVQGESVKLDIIREGKKKEIVLTIK